ncbi:MULTISPECIES: nucleotide pyrophosphohydrolase [Listeria]|uniref:nucleotide pyrophosphohydrolase n=1 Tax=Listeria TaxID=1637 RepID=UPI001628109C|nr:MULTISPECIES: nucleotide pyrophosphohydrolase [Listeria]MBC1442814.1 nucleotide pyrophosphohydrolase [Listeria seeligeri]MBC1541000.1 nucleotide pyrophosphohydrolase [Listeria seeligeri]MBC1582384.1 nucleotide pyrophosphohydrolase [Listeria seeligeri]MBC1719743.1 nucleotide pyrophosphohydrolase [Listeria seeligeri]MBC1737293.1 nucleotide pyrophosphohydrolase [Listeria seeligeri]
MDNLIREINLFRDEREWRQFHNAKDLALSVSLEASELLENFQWRTSEEAIEKNLENIKDEIADVMIYSLMLSDDLGLNIEEIIKDKIKKNGEKYPVEKSRGNKEKLDIKKNNSN